MDDIEDALKVGGFLLFAGAGCLHDGLKRIRQLRAVGDAIRSDIRNAPQGLVLIDGHALPYRKPIRNLRGAPSVFRELTFEVASDGDDPIWVKVDSIVEGERFIVSDGTGIAEVRTGGAEFLFPEIIHYWSRLSAEIQADLRQRYGKKVGGLLEKEESLFQKGRRFRILERCLEVGAPVCIRGNFDSSLGARPYVINEGNLRFVGKLQELRSLPGGIRRAFDRNRDGNVDDGELAAGSRDLMQAAHRSSIGDSPDAVAVDGIFLHDSVHGLVISDTHRDQVRRKLSGSNGLRIFGGIALISCGVTILLWGFE